jgi:putative sigma-54 modulation protein
MRLSISGLSFRLTRAIAHHVENRINLALGTASDRVDAVSVHLADINGNRGGADKRCQIVVWIRNLRTVVVDAVDLDLYAAVDAAARKARRSVWRHLKRRTTLRREYVSHSLQQLPA